MSTGPAQTGGAVKVFDTPKVEIAEERFAAFVDAIEALQPPAELEAAGHSFTWSGTLDELANCYFAIVAICHQTSPLGERRLEGMISKHKKYGWDYLKEKFLCAAQEDRRWSRPDFWSTLTPLQLSDLYEDKLAGKTLNRVSERALLLNDLGAKLCQADCQEISACFQTHGRWLAGEGGFLGFLATFQAYRDPVMKKSMFFLSLAMKECGWKVEDEESLRSVVDYHELRGHLRIGTLAIKDPALREKVERGMVLTEEEDCALRQKTQEVNDRAARLTGHSGSVVHYLCWNVFRNCCPRPADKTHCSICPPGCTLPSQYKNMPGYRGRCVFAAACKSADEPVKVTDPPYAGDFY